MNTFEKTVQHHFPKLEIYTLPVTRAHGQNHPEVFKVHDIFQDIHKIVTASSETVYLDKEFSKLREVTDGYQIPDDACETYEAVYTMLEELDLAYHQT